MSDSNNKVFSVAIPKIRDCSLDVKNDHFTLWFYEEYSDVFLSSDSQIRDDLKKMLTTYINGPFRDFKTQLEYRGIFFLVGFFYGKKNIRIYTPRLGLELFILEEYSSLENKDFLNLKMHVDEVTVHLTSDFPTMLDLVTYRYDLPDFLHDERFFDLEYDLETVVGRLLGEINSYRPQYIEQLFDSFFAVLAKNDVLRKKLIHFLMFFVSVNDRSGLVVKKQLLESLQNILNQDRQYVQGSATKSLRRPYFRRLLLQIIYKVLHFLPLKLLNMMLKGLLNFGVKRFIYGPDLESVWKIINRISGSKRGVSLEYLGEKSCSSDEVSSYVNHILKLIERFSMYFIQGDKNKALLPAGQMSIKLSSLDVNTYILGGRRFLTEGLKNNLKKIFKAAVDRDVLVFIDAEQYETLDRGHETLEWLLEEMEQLKQGIHVGVTLQAYLRDGVEDLNRIVGLAKKYKVTIPVRLVKGAYWDEEVWACEERERNSFQFLNKEETDLHYRQMMVKILEASPAVRLIIASHNFVDHAFSEVLRNKYFSQTAVIEHQCLYMTYEALSFAMEKMGWVVRNQVAIGTHFRGLEYLLRRVIENSSQLSILNMMRSHQFKQSLETPIKVHLDKKKKHKIIRDSVFERLTSRFFNVPPANIVSNEVVSLIDQEKISFYSEDKAVLDFSSLQEHQGDVLLIESFNNSAKLLGKVRTLKHDAIGLMLNQLECAYKENGWAIETPIVRSLIILRAAQNMLVERVRLMTLLALETGWDIADAHNEVNKVIDFLNFYGREVVRLERKKEPMRSKGVFYVLASMESPLAIPLGIIIANLCAGNSVVCSPAVETPLTFLKVVQVLRDSGIPSSSLVPMVINFRDISVLEIIAYHRSLAGISGEVNAMMGKRLYRMAFSRPHHNDLFNISFRFHSLLYLGGCNTMIITASADVKMAVQALLSSMIRRGGQSFYNISKVIVHFSRKDDFCAYLQIMYRELFNVGQKTLDSLDLYVRGDEIYRSQLREKLNCIVDELKEYYGREFLGQLEKVIDDSTNMMYPCFVELNQVRMTHAESMCHAEISAPVAFVTYYDDLEEAINVFNAADYIRSGHIFTQSSTDVKTLLSSLQAGNIFVNTMPLSERAGLFPEGGLKLSRLGPRLGSKGFLRAVYHSYSSEKNPSSVAPGRGSDYRFTLMRPSGLSPATRLIRVQKMLDIILLQYEAIFRGVYGEYKEILAKFRKWLDKDYLIFVQSPHTLYRMRGGQTYSDYNLAGEHAVFIPCQEQIDFSTFMRLIAAVTMGVGVTVVTRNEASFSWWTMLKDFIHQVGISKTNFDVFYSTQELLELTLADHAISYLVIDGNMEDIDHLCHLAHIEKPGLRRLKQVMTPYEAPVLREFKQYLSEFCWIRSISVDTRYLGNDLEVLTF